MRLGHSEIATIGSSHTPALELDLAVNPMLVRRLESRRGAAVPIGA
jgi:hypothetical protein